MSAGLRQLSAIEILWHRPVYCTSQTGQACRVPGPIVQEEKSANVDVIVSTQGQTTVVATMWLRSDESVVSPSRVLSHIEDLVVSRNLLAVYNTRLLSQSPFNKPALFGTTDASIL